MWKYIKQNMHFAILAAVCMFCEVLMDLIQPGIMIRIVDEGVLGVQNGGVGDMRLVWTLGLMMIGLVLFGGVCGSANNAFAHMTGQNIGNEMRKDAFRRIMTFSFPQVDRFGTGSLVTRVTNDITQVQNFFSQFVRGMIRTSMLMFGSIFFMFRLNHTFGLIVLCAFPFIVGVLTFCLSKANPMFSKLQAQLDRINAIMQEDVSGIRIIKACVREIYEKLRFGKANDELIKTQLQVLTIFAFMNPVVNALMYVVVTVILLTVLATKFLSKNVRKYSRKRQQLLGELNGTVEEMISGYRTVVAYNHQNVTTDEFRKTSDSLTKAGIRTDIFSGVMGPVMNCISNIGFVIITAFGGFFALNGLISVGVISAFIVYAKQFSRPINEIAQVYGQLQTAIAGAERVFHVLDEASR